MAEEDPDGDVGLAMHPSAIIDDSRLIYLDFLNDRGLEVCCVPFDAFVSNNFGSAVVRCELAILLFPMLVVWVLRLFCLATTDACHAIGA